MHRAAIPAVSRTAMAALPWRRVCAAQASHPPFVSARPGSPRRCMGFQPMRPPSPAELGGPRRARDYTRARRWGRRLLLVAGAGGVLYVVDRRVYASGIARSLHTFGIGLLVALDYKINFRPDPLPLIGTPGDPSAVHLRNAERIANLLRLNGGLYLKIGQAVAMQSAVLPPEFSRMFARMFDDAPQNAWASVEQVIRDDFGRSAEDVFGVSFVGAPGKGVMERRARASASVAQVHWARLPDGREVAVKIQKPEIKKQIGWDLWAFQVVARVYSYWFDLPLYAMVPFVSERLLLETDFENEAENSETMRALIAAEPALRGRVYVPIVYPELTTKRVMTTEWIEGVRLWDQDAITGTWRGGYGVGSPGVHGAQLPSPDMDALRATVRATSARSAYVRRGDKDPRDSLLLKPERSAWRGPSGRGGLGLSTTDVMTTMIDLFSAQMFKFGVVHCDPHPGNMFVRRQRSGAAELVLIDHGLYVYMSDTFRRQYSRFWKAMLTLDHATVAATCADWGIQAPELFASSTMLRPYEGGDERVRRGVLADLDASTGRSASARHYAMQQRMKQGVRDILADEDKWPKEFLFLGRTMRIVQANNQRMGSPVNRVKRMGRWASASLYEDRAQPWRQRLVNAWHHVVFTSVLALSDLVFYFFRLRQLFGGRAGLEDQIEAHMKDMAKDFGVELQQDVLSG